MIMKTIRLIISVFLTFIFFNLNAQVFIGGNIGFNTSGGSIDNNGISTDKPTTTSFNLSPIVGKFLSENFAVGAALNFGFTSTKTPGSPETTNTSSAVGITPFLRYYAVRMDKFSIFGQGNIGFSYSSSKSKSDGVTTDGPKTTNLFLNIVPGLSYDVSSKLALETTINILNFGFSDNIVKNGGNKNTTTSFGLGAGLTNIVSVGAISIGAIFKF
jgi:hypothetical protein